MSADAEIWRQVVGYEGAYEVSNHGRVRSVERTRLVKTRSGRMTPMTRWGKMLRATTRGEYPSVSLSSGPKRATKNVHALLAGAFLGPRPEGMQVCHRDGVKTNCHLGNLYYGTPKQNADDSVRHGTMVKGERVAGAKLTEAEVREIRHLAGVASQRTIAKLFNVHQAAVWSIINRKTWAHV